MTRSRKAILALVTWIPIILMLVASVIYISRQVSNVVRNVNLLIASELTQRFGREVKIGKAEVTKPGTAVIENLSIAKGKTLANGALLTARRIVIHYDWRAIAFAGKGAGAVSDVTIEDPRGLLIRRKDGTFNIADLLKPPPGPPRPPFKGIVNVTGGDITFLDYHVNAPKLPVKIRFHHVNASVDASKYPAYSFNGVVYGDRNQFASARFRGDYSSRTKRTRVDVDARSVSAPQVIPYLWSSRSVQVLAGKLDAMVGLDINKLDGRYRTTVVGTAKLMNAGVTLSILRAPVTGINGSVAFAGQRAAANLTGRFQGSPVRATGTIANFSKPQMNLAVTSPSISFDKLITGTTFLKTLAQIHPSGRGPARARITGALSNPVVDVIARVPSATVQGIPVRGAAVSAVYSRGMVNIRSLRFVARGAAVQAAGVVHIGRVTAVALQGRFQGVNLGAFVPKTTFPIAGTASGTVAISGTTAAPRIVVNASVSNGRVGKYPFYSATGQFEVMGTRVRVPNLRVLGLAGGSVRMSGSASMSAVDLSVVAEGIDLGTVAKDLGESGYGGTAFVTAHATGSVKDPYIAGSAEVFNGRLNDFKVNHAVTSFAGNMRSVTISDTVVQVFPAELRLSGQVNNLNTNRINFSGSAGVQRLEVSRLLELLNRNVDVSGTIVGDLTFSGAYVPRIKPGESHFPGVAASGNIRLEDGTAFGQPIESASAKLNYADSRLTVTESAITSEGAQLALNGDADTSTKQVNANLKLTGFDISRLQEYLDDYVVVAGTANATATVTGPWDNPKATAALSVDGLTVNYEQFDRASLQAAYADDKLTTYSLELARGAQIMAISGTNYELDTNCMASAKGTLTDISIPDLWDIFRASPFLNTPEVRKNMTRIPNLTSGTLNGSFELTGCMAAPSGTLSLSATDVGIDVQRIDTITLQASSDAGVVTLDQFRAASGDMSLEATGKPLYENGILNAELSAQNLDLSRLRPWLGDNTPSGTMSALFSVTGAAEAPQVKGSIEIVRPGFRGLTFDRLRASTVEVTANRIQMPDLLLTAGSHQATASISLPWDPLSLTIPRDEPLNITARLDKQDLNLLSVFVPMIDASRTTGVIQAQFTIDGTLLDPRLGGSASVTDGTIAVADFTNTFTNVTADLAFNGDRVVVNKLSASSSSGGTVYAVPGGYVTVGISGTSEVNLRIVADGLTFGERNLLGYQEDVSAQVDAGLAVTGSPLTPVISNAAADGKAGGVTVSHARLSFLLPSKPVQHGGFALPINPSFNVSLRLGQDVAIAPPNMNLVVDGGGNLTGTLKQPQLAMDLNVITGEIGLATVRLRIDPGGTMHIAYTPTAPPEIRLDLQASTSVFAINSLGQRERYQISMGITGTAANPQISLSSNPPGLTREQMLAALGHVPGIFTSAEAGLQQELAGVLTAVGTSVVFAPIENLFVQRLGFEQFSLEFAPLYPLAIYASRHLFGNFYLAFYRQFLVSPTTLNDYLFQVVLSYRFKSLYQFSLGVDDQQTVTFQINYAKAFR